jgi:MoxR-like ATPase
VTSTADSAMARTGWHIYRGSGEPHDGIGALPGPPPWRRFTAPDGDDPAAAPRMGPTDGIGTRPGVLARARAYRPAPDVVDTVNAAIFLRRPLLVTGKPGTGKSTLAYSIAFELGLGPVLYWPVTSRSTVAEALYRYDAIGRLQETNLQRDTASAGVPDIGRFLRLGPLGTALVPWPRPRVLLIDELDKSDIDLPNDLLNIFEEGQFDIPELSRLPAEQQPVRVSTDDRGSALIDHGRAHCLEFPIVVVTSNGEREFPPAFRRRCLSLYIQPPDAAKLRDIVVAQLGEAALADNDDLLREFVATRDGQDLATDQLLNLIFLASTGERPGPELRERLTELLFRPLGPGY